MKAKVKRNFLIDEEVDQMLEEICLQEYKDKGNEDRPTKSDVLQMSVREFYYLRYAK